MSQSKQDYLTNLPVDVKRYVFSFFTLKELGLFRSNINKDFYTICSKLKEEKLKEDYEKIQSKRLWYEELVQRIDWHFSCFYTIDTYDKFKAFITLEPGYLMTYLKKNINLIRDVSIMLSISGAEFSLQLMHKEKQKIKTLCESDLTKNDISFDEWYLRLVTDIRIHAFVYGNFNLFNNFFPMIVNSEMLNAIFRDMVVMAYNSAPLLDSGVDEDSEEGIVQVGMFIKMQKFMSKQLLDNYDDYKAIVQLLVDKGVELDSEANKQCLYGRLPSKQLKEWRAEHDYFLPEKIIALLNLVSKPSIIEDYVDNLEIGMY